MKNFDSLLPSFESIDEAADLAVGSTDEINYSDSEAAQYAQEQTAIGRDLERQQDLVEGGFQDIASLESLANAIDAARDLGMEMGSAEFMHIQLNDVQKRYGIDSLETAAPSMECFQERRARIAATASLESVKETAAKVWAWIKEQFAKFIAMMKNFYHQITKSLDYIDREADTIKQKVRRMKFEGGGQIAIGRAAKKICYEGEVNGDFTSRLNQVASLTHVGAETLDRIRQEVIERLNENGVAGREIPIPNTFTQVHKAGRFSFGTDALNVYASTRLPGDVCVLIQTFGNHNDDSAFHFASATTVHARVMTAPFDEDQKDLGRDAPALSSTEIFALCQRLQKTVAQLKSSRDAAARHIEKMGAEVSNWGRKAAQDRGAPELIQKTAGWSVKRATIYAGPLFRHCEKVAFDVCVGYLTYAKRSIAHAEEKASKPSFKPGLPQLTAD